MLVAKVITWTSSFLLLLYLPRYLGSENYGSLYLAISISMMLSIFIDFGGRFLIPKEVAKNKNYTGSLVVSYVGMRLFLWVIAMIAIMGFAYFVEYSRTVKFLILILGIAKLWEGVHKALRGGFQGHEKMEFPSLGLIVEKMFVAAVAIAALLKGAGPVTVALIMMVGVFLKACLSIYFTPKIIKQAPEFDLTYSFSLLKTSIPYFLWTVFSVIYFRIDAIMLSLFTGDETVGWYGAAYKLFNIVMFLPHIYSTVVFPILSKLWDRQQSKMDSTVNKSLKFLLISGIPVSVMIYFFSRPLIDLFFGLGEYGPAVILLQVFAFSVLLIYIDYVLGHTILATNKQKPWAVIGFVAILLNVGLNYLMIPYTQQLTGNGGLGAAVATFITEGFILGAALWILSENLFRKIGYVLAAKCLIAGTSMIMILVFVNTLPLHWILQGMVGISVYVLALYVLNVFDVYERKMLKRFFSYQTIKNELS